MPSNNKCGGNSDATKQTTKQTSESQSNKIPGIFEPCRHTRRGSTGMAASRYACRETAIHSRRSRSDDAEIPSDQFSKLPYIRQFIATITFRDAFHIFGSAIFLCDTIGALCRSVARRSVIESPSCPKESEELWSVLLFSPPQFSNAKKMDS